MTGATGRLLDGAANRVRNFVYADRGAVTVDWIVLTAAIVGFSFAIFLSVGTGVTTLGDTLGAGLSDAEVAALGSLNER